MITAVEARGIYARGAACAEQAVKVLSEMEANIRHRSRIGFTTMQFTFQDGNVEQVRQLVLEALHVGGFDVSSPDQCSFVVDWSPKAQEGAA